MRQFSASSKRHLATCDERLQRIFNDVILDFDCTVICGHRGQADQEEAFRTGKSRLEWPNSKHNRMPSLAADVAPYYAGEGIPWNDRERFVMFAGFVIGFASAMGFSLRWGGDWNTNRVLHDQNFHDLPHFELQQQ